MSQVSEKTSIVVVGNHNPPIHHPLWYVAVGIISQEESDSALSNKDVVFLPMLSQFAIRNHRIVCGPDRWECQRLGEGEEDTTRLVEIAAATFDKLDQTPVRAYGFNFVHTRTLSSGPVANVLATQVATLPLGLATGDALSAKIEQVEKADETLLKFNLGQSAAGPNSLQIAVNAHFDIGVNIST